MTDQYNPELEPYKSSGATPFSSQNKIKELEIVISEMQRNIQLLTESNNQMQNFLGRLLQEFQFLDAKFRKWPFIGQPEQEKT